MASQCSSTWLLGGYGVIGPSETTLSRTYTGLPAHNTINFFVEVWLIDLDLLGSAVNLFEIYFNGLLVQEWNLLSPTSMASGYLCGNPLKEDYITQVYGQVSHNQGELDIKIVKIGDSTNNFTVGFRSLQISLLNSTESPLVCEFKDFSGTDPSCECPEGSYNVPAQSKCTSCHQTCSYCFGAAPKDCLACDPQYYWNGQKCSKCDSTCERCDGSTASACIQCPTGSYLLSDNTCQSTCSPPMIVRNTTNGLVCQLPCTTGYFMYWNGSCISQCDPPLIQNTSISSNWQCELPCDVLLDEYYSPENNTCVAGCVDPFLIEQTEFMKVCLSPTINASNSTGTSSNTSNATNTTSSGSNTTNTTSSISNTTNTSANETSSESPTTSTDLVTSLKSLGEQVTAIGNVLRSSSTNSVFMVSIAKLIRYVVYIQVPLLDEVREAFLSSKSSVFSVSTTFTYVMPQSLQNKIISESEPVPSPFNESISTSSYLFNSWEPISTYLILMLLGIGFSMLERIINKFQVKALNEIIRRLRILTRWNFVILTLFNSYDNFTLYAFLEFRTFQFNSFWSIVSFLTCICISVIGILLLWILFKVCRQAQKMETLPDDPSNIMVTCQVLYAGYKKNSFLKQGCLLFQILRIIIYYILVTCVYTRPVIQTSQLTLISVLMLSYYIKVRPFADNFNLFATLIYEIFILAVNICLTSLAILDGNGNLTSKEIIVFSQIILICNTAIQLCATIFMFVYFLLGAKLAYEAGKTGLRGKTMWIYVPITAYENPGQDFNNDSEVNANIPKIIITEPQIQPTNEAKQNILRRKSRRMESTILVHSPNGNENDFEFVSERDIQFQHSSTLNPFVDKAKEGVSKPLYEESYINNKPESLRSILKRLFQRGRLSKRKVIPIQQETLFSKIKIERNLYALKTTPLKIDELEAGQPPRDSSLANLKKDISPQSSKLLVKSRKSSISSETKNDFAGLSSEARGEKRKSILLNFESVSTRLKDEESSGLEENQGRRRVTSQITNHRNSSLGLFTKQNLNRKSTMINDDKTNSTINIFIPRRSKRYITKNNNVPNVSKNKPSIEDF